MRTRRVLGEMLVDAGQLSAANLRRALEEGTLAKERVGETLIRLGLVPSEVVYRTLSVQLGIPFAPGPLTCHDEAFAAIGDESLRAARVAPLEMTSRTIAVAMVDPLDLRTIDDLQFQTGRRVEARIATPESVAEAIEAAAGPVVNDLAAQLPPETAASEVDGRALEEVVRHAPVVRLVDHLLDEAIRCGASDVHIEETSSDVRVRIRIDGILRSAADLPGSARRALLSRIKVMAGMDISVRRKPQDGRISRTVDGRRLTLRVSTLPVSAGEKAVVRVLDGESAPRDLSALGLAATDLASIRGLVRGGEGAILAAGPTGSGKSTTLFAALNEVDRQRRNVVTLEDPIEYALEGANQIQVDVRAGLGFAEALRAVLRQDPDVVMVGEIRDRETAEIAMAAAVTGHLVLSTIHTTDAPGAITRLLNMGVPPYLVAGGVAGIVAQRLVGKRCIVCGGPGCDECYEGVVGRTGVYQVLQLTDPMRDAISRGDGSATLRRLASESGVRSLASDARRVLATGVTTPHEVQRLVTADALAGKPCRACTAALPTDALACPYCGTKQEHECACGARLEVGWSFCPWCVRRAA